MSLRLLTLTVFNPRSYERCPLLGRETRYVNVDKTSSSSCSCFAIFSTLPNVFSRRCNFHSVGFHRVVTYIHSIGACWLLSCTINTLHWCILDKSLGFIVYIHINSVYHTLLSEELAIKLDYNRLALRSALHTYGLNVL